MKLNIITIAVSLLAGPFAFAQDVSIAKAAELGCHRLERLVDLGRLDETYLMKFASLKIALTTEAGAKFKWMGAQSAGSDGKTNTIELLQDSTGKTIGNPSVAGEAAAGGPNWPDKDPVTLIETALHYVLENGPNQPTIAPFFNALTEASIKQADLNGASMAVVEFKNSEDGGILEVTLKLDSTFVSAAIR